MRNFLLLLMLSLFSACSQTPVRKCCESLETGQCFCDEHGVCVCEQGRRSCAACKYLRTPAEEAAIKQQRLIEQAERAKSSVVDHH